MLLKGAGTIRDGSCCALQQTGCVTRRQDYPRAVGGAHPASVLEQQGGHGTLVPLQHEGAGRGVLSAQS